MNNRQGFSVLHTLLYATLLCMLTGFLFTFVLRLHGYIQKIQARNAVVMQWYAAYDFLCQDLAQISSGAQIKENTPYTLIYTINTKTVQWYYRNKKLLRKEIVSGKKRKSKALIAHSLENFVFDYTQGVLAFKLEGLFDAAHCHLHAKQLLTR